MEDTVKILLVEDEVITAMLMQRQLANLGYQVLKHVTTGEHAIDFAKEITPDFILMDIGLGGGIDGIDAATAILKENSVPIIFISGFDDRKIKERVAQINPLGFLLKPFKIEALKKMIDGFV